MRRLPSVTVVRESLELVKPLAAEYKLQFDAADALACQLCVTADSRRLKQVFINLLSNAVKYNCKDGQIERRLRGDGRVDTLKFRVVDSGPGMTTEEMSKLFVPFERLSAAHTNVEGTGLGLALSRGLVEVYVRKINSRQRTRSR